MSQPTLHPLPMSHPPVPLSHFPAIPFIFILLRTLLHSPKLQPFCFQALPHFLPKPTRGGGTPSSPSDKFQGASQGAFSRPSGRPFFATWSLQRRFKLCLCRTMSHIAGQSLMRRELLVRFS